MRSEYGSLRRRTRDSSWQWLLMGTILGMGFALVLCVGGYALGVLTFPVLEDNTSTPIVRVEPNETEVALQELALQQTLDAAQQTLTDTPTETGEDAAAQPTNDPASASQETEAPSVTPSPLPNGDESTTDTGDGAGQDEGQPSDAAMSGDGESAPLTEASTTPAPTQSDVVAMPINGTPVVGTPPVGAASPTLSLPGAPAIPAELETIKTDMVPVTGGTFLMGTTYEEGLQALDECAIYGTTCDDPSWVQDSTPPHQVTVDSFMMETYEVTVSQYVAFLNWLGPNSHKFGCQQGQPCAFTTQPGEQPEQSYINFDGEQYSVRNAEFYASHPVTLVTWWGAKEYCETLNRRLPTEAEWERAARGPENKLYPWGFEFENNRAQSSFPEATGTIEVDEFPNGASDYGVYNMAGNVSEWVSDWYLETYYNQQPVQPNPQGPPNGTVKVHRGGSWDTKPLFLRAVHRLANAPGDPTASIGFRCVSDQTTTPPPVVPVPSSDTGNPDSADGANTQPTMPPQPTFTPRPTPIPTQQPAGTLDPGG